MRKYILGALTVVAIEFFFAPLGGRVFDYFFPPEHGFGGMMPDIPFYQWGYASILAVGIVIGVAVARWRAKRSGTEIVRQEIGLSSAEREPTEARLRIVIADQPNQVREIVSENVFRWFVLANSGKREDTGEIVHLQFFLFVIFKRRFHAIYSAIDHSKSNQIRADLKDLSPGGAFVIFDGDMKDSTIDIRFSAKPL